VVVQAVAAGGVMRINKGDFCFLGGVGVGWGFVLFCVGLGVEVLLG